MVVIRLLCEWLLLVIFAKLANKGFAFDFLADEIVLCSWDGGAKMNAGLLLSSFLLVYFLLDLRQGLVCSWANLLVLLESEVDPRDRVSTSQHSNLMRRFSLKPRRRWVERNQLVFLFHEPNKFVFDLIKRLIVLLTPIEIVICVYRQVLWTLLANLTRIMLMTAQNIRALVGGRSSKRRLLVFLEDPKPHVWSHKLIFSGCAEH